MTSLTHKRREKLAKGLRADRVEAILVTSEPNVRYLTGFTGDSSALLLTRKLAIIVSDGRYTTQLQQECPDLEPVIRPITRTLRETLADVVQRLQVKSLGFEAGVLTVADHLALKEALVGVDMVGLEGRVEALRARKDESEIALIRESISAAERAYTMLVAGLRLDESELDAANALEAYLRRCGASAASFTPIVASGPHSALPHARPRDKTRLGDSDFLLVDWGACARVHPYKSDLTRVLPVGKVSAKFARVYQTVLAAQEAAIAAIRPGITAQEVDAVARGVIDAAGHSQHFVHGLGHGLGLDIHEAPRMRQGCETPLEAGMVITVEPGIYLPDWGGIRIEDDVLVRPDGVEILSGLPKSLDSLGPLALR
jgi:Xaa-Pro aminopeptidase